MSLSDYSSGSFGPKFSWSCPRPGCKKNIASWTEGGMRNFKEHHLEDHAKEDRENTLKFDQALFKSPRSYDKLKITWFDLNILKRAGIKVDEDMEHDSGKGAKCN